MYVMRLKCFLCSVLKQTENQVVSFDFRKPSEMPNKIRNWLASRAKVNFEDWESGINIILGIREGDY